MANGHGGYRQPRNPAPASGPGRLSRRTDGGPGQKLQVASGQPYGERQALLAQERLAPMAQSPSVPTPGVPQAQPPQGGLPSMTPLDAETRRPGEPITHGVPIGPGANSLNFPDQAQPGAGSGSMTALLQRLSATDATGILGQLMVAAQSRNA